MGDASSLKWGISTVDLLYYLKTLFELKWKFSSPAMVECSRPAAQPLLIARTASLAGWLVAPDAILSFLLLLFSSRSFLSQLSTVLYKSNPSRAPTKQSVSKSTKLISVTLSLSFIYWFFMSTTRKKPLWSSKLKRLPLTTICWLPWLYP